MECVLSSPWEFSFNFRRFVVSTGGGGDCSVIWFDTGFDAREDEEDVVVVVVVVV